MHLLNTASITVVTGGVVEGGRGYFGIALAVGKTVISRVWDMPRSDPRTMCSFRAEAYEFLAGIILVVGFIKLSMPNKTYIHTIHTDSASLLS